MRRFQVHFRALVTAGILLVVPLGFTFAVLRFLWGTLQGQMRPLVQLIPGPVNGIALDLLAIVALIIVLYFVGLLGRTIIGGRIVRKWEESVLERIPLVRSIYRIARESTRVFSGASGLQSTKVVMLEYPRPGVLSLGLVTGTYIDPEGQTFLTIYIPTIPNPTSGFLAIVKQEQVTETTMSFEDAMTIVVSAGVLTEEVVRRSRLPAT